MAKKSKTPTRATGGAGPLRYLSAAQTLRYSQERMVEDVRGLEWIAYPLMALVAWRTYARERKRQTAATVVTDRATIRQSLREQREQPAKRKRFLFF